MLLSGHVIGSDVEFAGRLYKHIPSPKKKAHGDDQILMRLHPAQAAPFFSKKRFRVVVAGRRWGKTHWVCIELLLKAVEQKGKCWYIAPTYSMAKQIAWEKLKEIIPRSWIQMGQWGVPKVNETSLTITLINGSTISLKGADRPDTLRGVGIRFVVFDEYQDMKPSVWTAVRPTLSDYKGKAIFIGTPKSFNHFYELFEKGQRASSSSWQSWQFKTADSPFIARSEILQAKSDMDIRTFRQEYEASFETMAGRVYYDFDRRLNVVPCPYVPSKLTWIGQDFNINPMSTVFVQPGSGDHLYVTGDMSLMSSSTEDVCRGIMSELGNDIATRSFVYPDPAGNAKQHARGETDVQIFKEFGFNHIYFRPKHPSIRDRLAAVNRLICDGNGHRRLLIDPSAAKLIECFEKLTYKEGTSEPDKSLNIEHPGDAFGYFAEYEHPVKKASKAKGFSY